MMKTVLSISAFLVAAPVLHAADSAYSALRILGKQNGADTLNRVVEVRGRNGVPAPAVWKVVLRDPKARGGVREVEIQRGKILAERTPVGRPLGAAMNFAQLNLDSEGAFTIANQQAQKAGMAFDRVDYILKSGTNGGAPVWDLQLLDSPSGHKGTLQIAADTGTVLGEQGLEAVQNSSEMRRDSGPDHASRDRDYLRRDPAAPSDRDAPNDLVEKEPIRDVPSFFRRVGQHFDRRGKQIKRFFTGQ
jgi:hypothetical protein